MRAVPCHVVPCRVVLRPASRRLVPSRPVASRPPRRIRSPTRLHRARFSFIEPASARSVRGARVTHVRVEEKHVGDGTGRASRSPRSRRADSNRDRRAGRAPSRAHEHGRTLAERRQRATRRNVSLARATKANVRAPRRIGNSRECHSSHTGHAHTGHARAADTRRRACAAEAGARIRVGNNPRWRASGLCWIAPIALGERAGARSSRADRASRRAPAACCGAAPARASRWYAGLHLDRTAGA